MSMRKGTLEDKAAEWRELRDRRDTARAEAEKVFVKLERVDAFHLGGEIWGFLGSYADGRREALDPAVGRVDAKSRIEGYRGKGLIVALQGDHP